MKILSTFLDELAGQGERLFLWAPVLLGLGIGIYFSLGVEPPLWLGPSAFLLTAVPASVFRKHRPAFFCPLAAAFLSLGFASAQIRTVWVAAPVLEKKIAPAMVSGRVTDIAHLPKGGRLLLEDVVIEKLDPTNTPRRVRLSFKSDIQWPQAGDRIQVLAGLSPPSPPVAPGAYDFQRHAWFEQLGAFGYPLGKIAVVAPANAETEGTFENLRQSMEARIRAQLGDGSAAGIASALLTGERADINDTDLESIRRSGLYHLLSISGTHMAILAGFIFFLIRGGLCLSQRIALNWPVKKIAALATFPVIFFYLILVGAPVPAQRAVIMTSVVLLAIATDRLAFNMRIVALAALVILLFLPESLVSPSFQMSFSAVVALIACYEALRGRALSGRESAFRRALAYFGGIALTSLVASLATAPFVLFHFQNVSFFWGILANMAAVPLTAFIIMPAGFIACVLMPLGLEAWPLKIAGFGIEKMLDVARFTGGFDSSLVYFKAWPVEALAVMTFGGLMLALWSGWWRFSGIAILFVGIAMAVCAPVPDILVSDDGKLFAIRSEKGLYLSTGRGGKFVAENWAHLAGTQEPAGVWPAQGRAADIDLACDTQSCIYNKRVAFVRDPLALEEDCQHAVLVVSAVPVRIPCNAKGVIDRFDLWRNGAHAIYLDGLEIRSVNAYRGRRPWTLNR